MILSLVFIFSHLEAHNKYHCQKFGFCDKINDVTAAWDTTPPLTRILDFLWIVAIAVHSSSCVHFMQCVFSWRSEAVKVQQLHLG